ISSALVSLVERDKLGDVKDFFKAAVLRLVGRLGFAVTVVPMVSDASRWSLSERRQYQEALDCTRYLWSPAGYWQAPAQSRAIRREYFEAIGQDPARLIFLDVDVGLSFTQATLDRRHVRLEDVELLLCQRPRRIVMVYQNWAQRNTDWGTSPQDYVLQRIQNRSLARTVVTNPHAAMLFLSRTSVRSIRQHLRRCFRANWRERVPW
ncbi:hypothetical protein ACFL59_14940, partial [Planctomycetota bacterium]